MNLKLEFFIAIRYLKSKNKEKFISITALFSFIGIMLGVATLIIVMSVMNGFREDFTNRILGVNSHISIFSKSRELENYQKAIEIIKQNSNVQYANPSIEGQVMIMSESSAVGGIVRGIKLEDIIKKKKIYDNIESKNFNESFKDNAILIGQSLATKLRVNIGDEITLVSPENNSTILGNIPRTKTYKIVGIFKSGMYEYDVGVLFAPLDMIQKHLKYYNDTVGGIEIYLKDTNILTKTYSEIKKDLKNNGYNVILVDWKESNSAFIGALNVERNVMFIILTLIIIVATFNIISSLTMLVNDKLKQIALLRTVGFTKGSITRIFFICGSLIGTFGTLLGTSIGILISKNIQNIRVWLESHFNIELFNPTIYFLTELPSKIIFTDIIYIVSISLILSFLSTIYPSYKASKTNPAEILRYE